jgi:PKD repeat protein
VNEKVLTSFQTASEKKLIRVVYTSPMRNQARGFTTLLVLLVLLAIVLVGGGFYVFKNSGIQSFEVALTATSSPETTNTIAQPAQLPLSTEASHDGQVHTVIRPGAQVSIDPKSMTVTPTSGTAPLKVTFTIAQGCANEEDLYFGDDPSETQPGASNGFDGTWPAGSLVHTYTSPGTYTATLYCSMPNTLINKTTITVR